MLNTIGIYAAFTLYLKDGSPYKVILAYDICKPCSAYKFYCQKVPFPLFDFQAVLLAKFHNNFIEKLCSY